MSENQGNHDLGGRDSGAVPPEHEPSFTDKKIDALVQLLRDDKRRLFGTDEMRRAVESLPGEVYDRHRYYERWMLATRNLLVEKGVLTTEEIERRLEAVRQRFYRDGGAGPVRSGE
jgi:hypothetical protein